MSDTKLRVLLTGRTEQIGKAVVELLLPEVEVIHVTLAEAVDRELPLLLKGERPEPRSSSIASAPWESGPPAALLLGGAYDEAKIRSMRQALGLEGNGDGDGDGDDHDDERPGATRARLPWIRVDSARSTISPTTPEYPADVVRRLKGMLLRLQAEGKLHVGNNGVYAV